VTSKQILSAKPGQTIWDDQVRGLHIRVFDTKRTFYLKYRTKSGQQRKPKLGDFPTLNLTQAREIARERLYLVSKGEDPATVLAPQRTMKDLYDACVKDHYPTLEPASVRDYIWAWEKRIIPALGKKNVNAVTEAECLALFHSMRHGPTQANRVMACLRAAFNLAERWGWKPRHTNPVQLKLNQEQPRERYPSAEEAAALFNAIDGHVEEQPTFTAYLWLLALTGGRPGEIRKCQWGWIQPAGIVLPRAKRRKKGRIIELSSVARDFIARLPRVQDNPYLFPGRKKGTCIVGVQKFWERMLKSAGLEGLQMRDMRRYYATLVHSKGHSIDHIAGVLGHAPGSRVTARHYSFLMKDARQEIAETAAAELVRIRGASIKEGAAPASQ